MPPLNLLFLPLLGGFIFVSKWYPTRYYTLRSDGYRLVFTTAVAGAMLLFVASVLRIHLAPRLPWWPGAYVWWHQIAPPEHSGTAALAMLLGSSLWLPLNLIGVLGSWVSGSSGMLVRFIKWFSDEQAIRRSIIRKRDSLELFLTMALEGEKMISVSVKNGKVYVGYLTSTYNPAFEMESISLIPAYSGHRSEDTKEMVLDLNYLKVYEAIQPGLYENLFEAFETENRKNPNASADRLFKDVMNRLASNAGADYEIILPIGEVQSVNVFHVDSYLEYFTSKAYQMPRSP